MKRRFSKKRVLALIDARMNRLRAPKTESFIDSPSGRTETIEKGEWIGSPWEFDFYTKFRKEVERTMKLTTGMKVFIGLMLAHWLEHAFQAYQVYVLHMQRACALGMLGMKFPWLVKTESLHFAFAVLTTVMLVTLKKQFRGWAYHLWDAALGISLWHLLEHTLLFYQAVTGHFLFGASQPTSILQLGFPRIELHLFYNSIVTIPSMLAIILNKPARTLCEEMGLCHL